MPTIFQANPKVDQLRATLGHPIVDADAHQIEMVPLFLDILREVGGAKSVDQMRTQWRGRDAWYRATPEERLAYGFRLVIARKPTAEETAVLVEGLSADLTRFRADAAAAKKLLGVGEASAKPGLDPAEAAAYTLAANVLLNLDEALTKN